GQAHRQRHWRRQGVAGRERGHAGVDDLGQRQLVRVGGRDEFVHRALHQDAVADRRRLRRRGRGEHKDALGGRRIAIVLAVGRLHEEAVVLAAGDDAGGRHRHAVVWRKRAVALDRGDRERGDVVVDDAADALRVGEFGADGVGQLDGEALVRLVDGVADHFHADRHRGRAFGDGRGAAGGVVVVVRRGRGAVGGRVVHAHAAGAGRLVEADGEEDRAGAGIALGGAGVADAGERRSATAAGGGRGGAVARRG